jgi:WD40 repeat protein
MKRFFTAGAIVLCIAISAPVSAQTTKGGTLKLMGKEKFEIKHHIHSAAFSPDGKLLALGEDNVHIFDMTASPPTEKAVYKSRSGAIEAMMFSPDGKLLAFGGGDHTVRVWSVEDQQEVANMKEHKATVRAVTFSPDGKLLATGSDDRTCLLWDVGADGKLTEKSVLKGEDKLGVGSVKSAVFAQKGKVLVTGSSNGAFRVYNIAGASPKQTNAFTTGKGGFGDVSINSSPNGQLWSITDHKSVHIINTSGVQMGILQGHKEDVADAAFSPDGKYIATAGRDGALHVWSLASAKRIVSEDRPGKFSCIAFAPKVEGSAETTLIAALEDGIVWVLKLGTGK